MKFHIDALNVKLGKVLEALRIGPRENNDDDNSVNGDNQTLYNYTRLSSSLEHDEPSDAKAATANEEEAAIDEAYEVATVDESCGIL